MHKKLLSFYRQRPSRRSSSFNTERVDHLYQDPHERNVRFTLHYGDMTDATNLIRVIQETQPTEIYNIAAQSHVQVSFETPEYTANADALGPLRLLEAIRILGLEKRTRFYQASTSELYGTVRRCRSAKRPRSIRGARTEWPSSMGTGSRRIIAKPTGCMRQTASYSIMKVRTRGETFVTRKITRAVAAIELGLQDKLYLGNLDAMRDWGHARDYVEGMWMIVQQPSLTTMCWRPAKDIRFASSSKRPLRVWSSNHRMAWFEQR